MHEKSFTFSTIKIKKCSQIFWTYLFVLSCLFCVSSHNLKISSSEALFLKRVTEFWKEGDYDTAKRQIIQFLENHPESPILEHLHALLGDLYFLQNQYADAITSYAQIHNRDLRQKTHLHYIQALFEVKDYIAIIEDLSPFFQSTQPVDEQKESDFRHLLAESLLRVGIHTKDEEKQKSLLREALKHYLLLTKTQHDHSLMLSLAEIYRVLQEHEKAANLYLLLIEKYPEMSEELLFRAGHLQAYYNKTDAIQTFSSLSEKRGKYAPLAAYNEISLLFETGKYETLLKRQKELRSLIPSDKIPMLHFYIGMSLDKLQKHEKAIFYLNKYISQQTQVNPELKTACLTLLNLSRTTENLNVFEQTLKRFKQFFPEDAQWTNAQLIYVQMCVQQKQIEKALDAIREVLVAFPQHETKESLLCDYASLFTKMQKWEEARAVYKSFLEEFPKSAERKTVWQNLLFCAEQNCKTALQGKETSCREHLIADLKEVLKETEIFTSEELHNFRFSLIQKLFDSQDYEGALSQLNHFLMHFPDHPKKAQAHLLSALCYQKLKVSDEQFIFHAEEALSLNPSFSNDPLLHLHLFNAYLKLSKEEEDPSLFTEKAASHLFQTFELDQDRVDLENRVWLAHYYYHLSSERKSSHYLPRATALFESLLQDLVFEKAETEDAAQLREEMTFKCAELYGVATNYTKQIGVLENLLKKQQELPENGWTSQRRTLFELAKAYQSFGDKQSALKIYEDLILTSSHLPSYFADAAILERAKLKCETLPLDATAASNPEIEDILTSLKDLQIRKQLQHEPLHLEAALQYAEMKISLTPPENKIERALFFLNRIKEDFNDQEEIFTKDYHAAFAHFPEKEQIFKTYMQFLDAEILRLELEKEKSSSKSANLSALAEKTVQAFSSLDERPLNSFLAKRIQKSKAAIYEGVSQIK